MSLCASPFRLCLAVDVTIFLRYMHVRKHGYSWNACLYVATARGARLDARLAELGIPICDTAAPARLNGSLNWNARFAQTIPFASRYATGVIPEPRNQDLESTHQEKLSIRTLAADTQDMATLPRYYDIQQLPPQCYQETFVWGCEDAVRE